MHKAAGVPLKNLHMGGDEVPAGVWEKSPAALAYLKANGLSSADDLWFVLYGRVEQILKRHGIPPSGWEEMGVRKTRVDGVAKLVPNPGFAARGWRTYVWNNVPGWGAEDLAYRLANGGYQVVLAPVTNVYLDMAYTKNPEEPGLFWGGFADIDKPFDFIPFDYYKNGKEDNRGNPLPPGIFVRQGSPQRLRPRQHRRPRGVPVVGDVARGRPLRVHAHAEAARLRRAGMGARSGVGTRDRHGARRRPLSRWPGRRSRTSSANGNYRAWTRKAWFSTTAFRRLA